MTLRIANPLRTIRQSCGLWSLVGRFKARNGVANCYMIPIAGETCLGIKVFVWTQQFIGRLAMDGGITQGQGWGWAFRKAITG